MSGTLRVWAPHAQRVEAALEGRREPLQPQEGGWWRLARPTVAPGTDYAFHLDGGAPLPDPRSPRQPYGVHGPSQTLDHGAHGWQDDDWQPPSLSEAVIYELHVGTFSRAGTFDGAAEHLDALLDLGVSHVELMPVATFAGRRNWGYDGAALYAPHEAYGGPEGLKRLVAACHARGLAVLLDVVYNHLGPEGNYLSQFGPYFTDRYATPWGQAVNLDGPGSDEVRRFICDNALMWLYDYHIDGLRIDAVHAIYDFSAIHILEQLAAEVAEHEQRTGRRKYLIAESDLNDPRIVRPWDLGGYGIDAQWSDDFHHALHTVLTGERNGYYADFGKLEHLARALTDAFVYDGRYSRFRRRRHGRPAAHLSGHRFLGYLQTHDQVGNRARGERAGHLMSTGKLKIAAAFVCCAPYVPMFFQGEEWAASTPFCYFTDFEDADLQRAVREGRIEEFAAFGWDPQEIPDPGAPETFARSRLDWRERERSPHREMLAWYRRLLRLRREHPELTDGERGRVRVAFDEEARWLRMSRGRIQLAGNLAAREVVVPLDSQAQRTILLASDERIQVEIEEVTLPAESVVILGPPPA